jgi:hypothetical protein
VVLNKLIVVVKFDKKYLIVYAFKNENGFIELPGRLND